MTTLSTKGWIILDPLHCLLLYWNFVELQTGVIILNGVMLCVSSFWVLLRWVQFKQNCIRFCVIMFSWKLLYWVASFWMVLCYVCLHSEYCYAQSNRQNSIRFCVIMLSWMLLYWVASFWVLLCWMQIGRTAYDLVWLCWAIILGLVTQSVVIWMVIKYYAEWRCTWCLYAECHGTYSFLTIIGCLKINQTEFKFVQNVVQLQAMLD
jgi:hypothetical protein